MKKSFLIWMVGLSIIFANPVNAQNIKSTSGKNPADLREIVLDKEHYYNSERENLSITKNTSSSEYSLEDKSIKYIEKNLLPVFNLEGGVEKAESIQEAQTQETNVEKWLNDDYATGRWFGAKPLLEDHGIIIKSSLLYGPAIKTRGGANDAVSAKGYSLFNLSVTVDTEKAGLWKGGTFYALYQNKRGTGLSNRAMGDYQTFDSWDFREINQISEYWYQQKLFKDKLRLKLGKQDANADFCFLNSGLDFMNLSFSVNPTVLLPTYPDQSFGFVAAVSPKEWITIKNGIYSRYNNPFNISEIEFKPEIKKLPGRYMLGAWELSDSNGVNIIQNINYSSGDIYYNNYNRNFGWYAGFEQMVYKEKKNDDDDMQGLVVFGQFGMSPSNRNEMSRYVGGGINYVGPIPKRDNDIAGIGIASGAFAPRLGDITSQVGSENAIEAFYRIQITPWFYLQPDVQLITRPSGYYDNSVAFGLRSVITF